MYTRLKQLIFGKPRDIKDPHVFHNVSLIAFLAWVGLGADGLSSSAYGPDEAFRALGSHTHLAIILVAMTAITIVVISIAYSNLIEHFPGGGGGYLVASKLLGPRVGVVSGSALLVDYVLTISVSIAALFEHFFDDRDNHFIGQLNAFVDFLLFHCRGQQADGAELLRVFFAHCGFHIFLNLCLEAHLFPP
jgi:amino acid transporter